MEEEQLGSSKASYGKRIIADLSQRLTTDFGKGFDRSNLFHMRAFFLTYPKIDALRRQLSWTHYAEAGTGPTTAVTGPAGIASVSITANFTAGSFEVTASIHHGSKSTTFDLTNSPAHPSGRIARRKIQMSTFETDPPAFGMSPSGDY